MHWLVTTRKGALHLGTWLCPRTSLTAARDHFLAFPSLYPSLLHCYGWESGPENWVLLSESSQLCVNVTNVGHLAGWVSSSLSFFHLFSVTVSTTCEKLEKARNELQIAYEGFVQKLNQQHQTDLTELENRLKEFYTGECEKLQNIYIEEAEKYKTQLQEQVCTFRTWACAWPLLLIWILTVVWWGSSSDDLLFVGCPLMNFIMI